MDIPTHCVFRFLFYLFTQLTCIFSQIWTNFLHVMCCFIFLFLHLSFSAIFCSVILHVSNFPSCLHLFFFFPLFALFLIFCAAPVNFSPFISPHPFADLLTSCYVWVIVLTFSFCLFFPLPFFPTLILFFFIFFFLFQCKADGSRKFCGFISLASGLEVYVILALNNLCS